MARERASAGPEISLFPFLSILACLIGALTILIVALSVSEILQGRKDESVARAEDYVALQTEIADREAEIARREEELRRTNATVVELAEIQPRIKEMQAELEDLRTDASKLPPLVRQMEEARKERDRIETLTLRLLLSDLAAQGIPAQQRIAATRMWTYHRHPEDNIPPLKGIEQRIEVRINNLLLPSSRIENGWLLFDVQPQQVARGNNLIGIRVAAHPEEHHQEIRIEKVELAIDYRDDP